MEYPFHYAAASPPPPRRHTTQLIISLHYSVNRNHIVLFSIIVYHAHYVHCTDFTGI